MIFVYDDFFFPIENELEHTDLKTTYIYVYIFDSLWSNLFSNTDRITLMDFNPYFIFLPGLIIDLSGT